MGSPTHGSIKTAITVNLIYIFGYFYKLKLLGLG